MNKQTINKNLSHALKFSTLSLAIACSFNVSANIGEDVSKAVKDSKVDVSLRYRVETVDQDGASEDAMASTLKSRLTVTTGKVSNFSAKVEVDDVTAIGNDSYNSTVNGKTDYPVVADPEGSEVNQAYLQYSGDMFTATAGRQRIVLDDQRFVGGVAWRQNEQTYDGYRLQVKPVDKLTLDASYVYNVNRIFGEDSGKSDLHGDVILLNAKYKFNKQHALTVFNYSLEFDGAAAGTSSNTMGATYNGNFDLGGTGLAVKAGFANQEDAGDNPTSFEASYMVLEAMAKFDSFSVGGGYEVLGSDDGNIAFSTPLATLHKFQGFADKFLNTPADGIVDTYVKAATKVGPVGLSAAYHIYEADEGNDEYGNEFNIAAGYKFNKQVSGLLKAASYSSDDYATDTTKIWFMVTANF
ncbi:porin [Thalassotalea nanhaiensis]|uniref:Porin n=1 Tax=Thalassotalea nanhaiensis TaxID=3065648 RepID=A0ABY9TGG2_9GAMM|nr:porin [Colwelliaceae bacterium SQ345]